MTFCSNGTYTKQYCWDVSSPKTLNIFPFSSEFSNNFDTNIDETIAFMSTHTCHQKSTEEQRREWW